MTEAQEMTAFVTARLGEWEAAAKDAAADCPAPWRDDYGDLADASGTLIVDGAHYGGAAWRGDTIPHIVLHDPATTLLLVASLRKLVTACEGQPGYDLPDGVQDGRGLDGRAADAAMLAVLTGLVRGVAAIWSTHPEYQERWKP